ncbi:MAG TPA: methyltransferase domain-containing protein [Longimicrobiaceae bacterium]|nr:methyltransferase domain-containing protein [Longimicrobiaceae bacterium]
MPAALYDRIGRGYAAHRRPDARIAGRIAEALGDARTVVNVGAGAGSYEPSDRAVVAVEPSAEMIRQRAPSAAPAVQAAAEALPFGDASFEAAMAVLTIHHWGDARRGLAEMRRVARERIAILTWNPDHPGFWLTRDYFPEILPADRETFPTLRMIEDVLGAIEVRMVPVPADCTDGFLGAYWRRPEAYLDPGRRAAISAFAKHDDVDARIARLRADLADGTWERRNGDLLRLSELDLGYRLYVAR